MIGRTRFNPQISFYVLLALASSFVFSLFLLQLFGGFLVSLWLFEKNVEKKKSWDTLSIAILIFLAVRIIAIALSEFPSESNQSLYKEALFYLGFFSLNFYIKRLSSDKKIKLIRVFLLAAIVASLSGIIMFNLRILYRAESFSSGSTVFSYYLLAALPVLIFIPLKGVDNIWRILRSIGTIIIFTGIITAQGRQSILTAIIFLLIGVFARKIKIRELALILFASCFISIISFYNNAWLITKRMDNPYSLSDRDVLFKGAKQIMYNHPIIGYGPRTFMRIFPIFHEIKAKGVSGWHNDFLQIYFDSGLTGIISFLLLIIIVYWTGIRSYTQNWQNRSVILGLLLSVSSFIFSTLTSGFITSVVLSIVFVFIITVLNSYNENYWTGK
jgi:O-antigen ligase